MHQCPIKIWENASIKSKPRIPNCRCAIRTHSWGCGCWSSSRCIESPSGTEAEKKRVSLRGYGGGWNACLLLSLLKGWWWGGVQLWTPSSCWLRAVTSEESREAFYTHGRVSRPLTLDPLSLSLRQPGEAERQTPEEGTGKAAAGRVHCLHREVSSP